MNMSKEKKEPEYIDVAEMNIILGIPENAAQIEINATVLMEDGTTQKVSKKLNTKEIMDARKDFLDYVGDDYNAVYTLTDSGREWLEQLKKERGC